MPGHAGDVSVGLSALWMWLSLAAALVSAAGCVAGFVFADSIYGGETVALADAAAAQDVVKLALVAPSLIVLAIGATRGSLRARLCWFGCLAFTAYNYAIYAFSIHLGPLFLPWVAVLGLSVFAPVGGLATVDAPAVKNRFTNRAVPLAAWFLIVVAMLFILLWLSEIPSDLVAGDPSRSAIAWQIPTNPVHVIDLALFLPAVFASGVLLLRRHPLGYATARGHDADWVVMFPVGIIFAGAVATLGRTLQSVGATPGPDPDGSQSAAGRAGGEGIWVPTSLLPRFGVTWSADDETHITALTDSARHRLRSTSPPPRWPDPIGGL